ncbi:hypothetical protein BKA63DRAFT_510193 [Paraphoma chrysanthemicola]|nr:hypothetical protein BKA63DRAFT_510193 [Paraphoma chrysanthemicola]
MAFDIPVVNVDDLRAFHAKHFPHAPTPESFLHGVEQGPAEEAYEEDDDGLGYYPDGTKRTLTDEQIAMFRHSEIQAILRKRRQRREGGELSEEGEAEAEPEPPRDSAAPVTAPNDKVQSGRVEKLKTQQWATSSPRTKARNKRHRDNYKAKKQMMRREKERAQKTRRDEDEESDEWDPWHQAKGPDVQKDDTQELDY